jgi:hypothetical protein
MIAVEELDGIQGRLDKKEGGTERQSPWAWLDLSGVG